LATSRRTAPARAWPRRAKVVMSGRQRRRQRERLVGGGGVQGPPERRMSKWPSMHQKAHRGGVSRLQGGEDLHVWRQLQIPSHPRWREALGGGMEPSVEVLVGVKPSVESIPPTMLHPHRRAGSCTRAMHLGSSRMKAMICLNGCFASREVIKVALADRRS
jgi:hypothetical protein